MLKKTAYHKLLTPCSLAALRPPLFSVPEKPQPIRGGKAISNHGIHAYLSTRLDGRRILRMVYCCKEDIVDNIDDILLFQQMPEAINQLQCADIACRPTTYLKTHCGIRISQVRNRISQVRNIFSL